MKPYQTIKAANDVIKDLKYELQFSKNKVKDAKRINTLLDALKSFDDMLTYKHETDAIDTLIYAFIYESFLMHRVWENGIPIHSTIENIDFALRNGAEQKKAEIISMLKLHELNNKARNKTIFDKNYINFDELLTETLKQIKQTIKWNKLAY